MKIRQLLREVWRLLSFLVPFVWAKLWGALIRVVPLLGIIQYYAFINSHKLITAALQGISFVLHTNPHLPHIDDLRNPTYLT